MVTQGRSRTSRALSALAVLAAWAVSAASVGSAEDPAYRFHRAREAYDAGDYGKATAEYRILEDAGFESVELLFNLGNAFFRASDRARAVWYYRRAMRMAPRNADVQANLRFALGEAGSSFPSPGRAPGRWLRRISRREWNGVLRAGYTLAALAAGLSLWVRKGQRAWRYAAAAGIAGVVLASSGLAAWSHDGRHREAVVIADEARVLFAPIEGHAEHFRLPQSALVRRVRTDRDWSLVRYAGREGWMPSEALARLDISPGDWPDAAGETP